MNVQEEEARLSGNSDLVSLCDSIASYRSLEDAFAEQKAPPAYVHTKTNPHQPPLTFFVVIL